MLGRLTALTAVDTTQSSSTDYDAFTVTTIDAGGRRNRLIADALGRTTRTENRNAADVVLTVTEYLYDKAGNLTTVQKRTGSNTLIGNTVITNTFDRLGRRLTTTDDFGAGANGRVDFSYDSMSDLRRQQTPRLRAQSATLYTELDYDLRIPVMPGQRSGPRRTTIPVMPGGCEAVRSEDSGRAGEPRATISTTRVCGYELWRLAPLHERFEQTHRRKVLVPA